MPGAVDGCGFSRLLGVRSQISPILGAPANIIAQCDQDLMYDIMSHGIQGVTERYGSRLA